MGILRRRSAPPAAATCACGAPLDPLDMDYGFQLPDEVFALSPDEQQARCRGRDKVFVLDGTRGFVRVLLPVRLDRGSVQFGLWVEVSAEAAEAAVRLWDEPAYASLRVEGRVVNAFAPWGDELAGARVSAAPSSQDDLPTADDGDDLVRALLQRRWPRAALLAALPDLAHPHG